MVEPRGRAAKLSWLTTDERLPPFLTYTDKSVIKFTFNLFDPSDWSREANFVIDASKAQYQSAYAAVR